MELAQYSMARANTLLLTGSIFVLAFVTALPMKDESPAIVFFLAGFLAVGLFCIFIGLKQFFAADKIFRSEMKRNSLIDVVIVFGSWLIITVIAVQILYSPSNIFALLGCLVGAALIVGAKIRVDGKID
ncbi:hypothetical protein J4441_00325 [Candidatus Micrarchaeota archaeon]|nr:hypothetical protein [Candidatus Micrarchaeota archaeon]